MVVQSILKKAPTPERNKVEDGMSDEGHLANQDE